MSFILDALKKSEAERNRKSGPVLMDMRIAPAASALAGMGMGDRHRPAGQPALLGYALLRAAMRKRLSHPCSDGGPHRARQCPCPLRCRHRCHCHHRHCQHASQLPEPPAATPGHRWRDHAKQCRGIAGQCSRQFRCGQLRGNGAAPATPAAGTGNLPSDDDLRASGVTLPELHLSLHVYDDVAANRFVLLNSSRLREGQETAEGVMVERIDPTGVVLSWRGRRFRMHPGN